MPDRNQPIRIAMKGSAGNRITYELTDPAAGEPSEIWFEVPDEVVLEQPVTLDGIAAGTIFRAMQTGRPLLVEGKLSYATARKLMDFQSAWARWRPERYRTVEIRAAEFVDQRPLRGTAAISAFSGGVDAFFNLIHNQRQPPALRYDITHALLVHGFDIPLSASTAFNQVAKTYREILSAFGTQLLIIRTNIKELNLMDWEHSHAGQLSACFAHAASGQRYGLIGSSEAYDELVIPWGSSPMTDHLLSTQQLEIVHYGAGYPRSEKVAAIADHPSVQAHLRVCWQGPDPASNCHQCEKCMRTRLNFAVSGSEASACLGNTSLLQIAQSIDIRNELAANELTSIVRIAKQKNLRDPWVGRLERRLTRWRARRKLALLKSRFRQFVHSRLDRTTSEPKPAAQVRAAR